MSKKGPRTDAYLFLTASLSDEVMARYLDLAHHVREREKARRREAERRKAAEKKKRLALLKALYGWAPPKKNKGKKKKAVATAPETAEKPADSESGPATAPTPASAPGLPDIVPRAHPGGSRQAKPITREEILKLLVADDLGYLEKVREDGWGGLSCAETGRVGGMMTRRMKRLDRESPAAPS